MARFLGYRKNQDGTIIPVDCEISNGELFFGVSGLYLTDETTELKGWPDEGKAIICETCSGVQVIVPEIRLEGYEEKTNEEKLNELMDLVS